MKNDKAVGTDDLPIESIKSIDDFGIDTLRKMLSEIYKFWKYPSRP